MERLREVVRLSDVPGWAEQFLARLVDRMSRPHPLAPSGEASMTDGRRPVLTIPSCSPTVGGRPPRPLLVGLDVDGVLAPIVDHADDATLLPGMLAAVTALAERNPGGDRLRAARSATSTASDSRTARRRRQPRVGAPTRRPGWC